MKRLWYDLIGASENKIKLHPQNDMDRLGFKVIGAVPESIADGWNFLVKDYDFDLPDYISECNLYPDYWKHYYDKTPEELEEEFDISL